MLPADRKRKGVTGVQGATLQTICNQMQKTHRANSPRPHEFPGEALDDHFAGGFLLIHGERVARAVGGSRRPCIMVPLGVGPPGPGESLDVFQEVPTKWVPDRQDDVGDHFGNPRGLQVTALNSKL